MIPTSDKAEVKPKQMVNKDTVHKRNIKLMNNYAPNNTVTIFMKQKIQKVQRGVDKNPLKIHNLHNHS